MKRKEKYNNHFHMRFLSLIVSRAWFNLDLSKRVLIQQFIC